ncbi:unnamed protein product [[Candida] boidinii]|nr:unnamed protein product [[Candida] boidinii]
MIIKILFLYWLFAFANAETLTYTSNVAGCIIPPNRLQPGLSVNIYSYNTLATSTLGLNTLYSGYTTLSKKYSNTVVSPIYFHAENPTTMTIWDMQVTLLLWRLFLICTLIKLGFILLKVLALMMVSWYSLDWLLLGVVMWDELEYHIRIYYTNKNCILHGQKTKIQKCI